MADNVLWQQVDGVSVVIPVWGDDFDGPEWVQRHGTPERVVEQRMSVASLIAAYSHMIDPTISQAEAVEKLKRARRAAKENW